MLEVRISELKEAIASSIVVQSSKQWNTVQYGSTVTLSLIDKQENITVVIVWSAEISFENEIKHISFDSPIGMAIEGKKMGDICKVRSERGRFDVKILKIA
jgi:transcription elongation factor GreA